MECGLNRKTEIYEGSGSMRSAWLYEILKYLSMHFGSTLVVLANLIVHGPTLCCMSGFRTCRQCFVMSARRLRCTAARCSRSAALSSPAPSGMVSLAALSCAACMHCATLDILCTNELWLQQAYAHLLDTLLQWVLLPLCARYDGAGQSQCRQTAQKQHFKPSRRI